MPTATETIPTPDPRIRIEGKTFYWTTEDGDEVCIPLRVKMRVLRALPPGSALDIDAMFSILHAIIPGAEDDLDDMDVNDFQAMFTAWQVAYTKSSGASLGESGGSSA